MKRYLEARDFLLNRICLDYKGGRYRGRGVMNWDPQSGFHIEVPVERTGPPLPPKDEWGRVSVVSKEDTQCIRIRPAGYEWAIAPDIMLTDRMDLTDENRLSINVSRVVFHSRHEHNKDAWCFGSALLATKDHPLLPDSVVTKTTINDRQVLEHWEHGFSFEDERIHVSARHLSETFVELNWSVQPEYSSKRLCWKWPVAFAEALSILSGQTVHVLRRQINHGKLRYSEMSRQQPVESLNYLSMFDDRALLDRNRLVDLAWYLVNDGIHAQVCRHIFRQMVEANNQNSWQACELLCATILEAALRSVDNHPFKKNDNSWNRKSSMQRFRKRYLTDEWIKACDLALEAHTNLRHRNAHPDWLDGHGGSLSRERLAQGFDEMIRLSHFYGYMILALAGISGIKPLFPKPHKDWAPAITVSRGVKPEVEGL